MSGQGRTKLLIVGGQDPAVRKLIERLGDGCEIVGEAADPTDPRVAENGHECLLVSASAGHALASAAAGPAEGRSVLLLDAIGEGVCLAGIDGTLLWENEFFRGLSEKIRVGVGGMCREAAAYFAPRIARGAPSKQLTVKFEAGTLEEGAVYDIFITPAAFRDSTGTPSEDSAKPRAQRPRELHQVAAVVREVTAQRRHQLKMAAIDNAGFELVRLDAEAVRKMNTIERLKLLEDKIVRYTKDLLSYDHFAIFLIEQSTRRLELVISSGLPREIEDFELHASAEGSGISGFVAHSGRSYICQDAQADERFLPGLPGARSSLTVPLRLHDRVVGVMDIESQTPRAFDDEDRLFAEIFARHVALALHMLDLLVAERTTTNTAVSDRVEGELAEPLDHIMEEVGCLKEAAERDPQAAEHLRRIIEDVEAIRRRVREVAAGPQTLLGVERALADREKDPLLEGRRILVADDQPKIRKIIAEVLRCRGCDVAVCENGQTAIDLLQQVGAGDERPFDLVISDIKMPDRNGYEVFSAARRNTPGAPVILMTGFGYDPHHSIVRATQEGLANTLFKPFDIERLIEHVKKALAPESAEQPTAGKA